MKTYFEENNIPPRQYHVSELFLDRKPRERNWYKFTVPWEHFYRDVGKLNGFFFGMKRKKYYRRWTDIRMFSLYRAEELECFLENEERWHKKINEPFPEFKVLKEFDRIDDFFDHIGYDRKTQKYVTGEKLVLYKHWKE
jgi:hypothetical protein